MKKGDKFNLMIETTIATIEDVDEHNSIITVVITDQSWPSKRGAPRLQGRVQVPKEMMKHDPVVQLALSQQIKTDVLNNSAIGLLTQYKAKIERERQRVKTAREYNELIQDREGVQLSEKELKLVRDENESLDDSVERKELLETLQDKVQH